MTHAETCPVCGGKGKIQELGSTAVDNKICQGCDGKGWVSVQDNNVPSWLYEPCPPVFRKPVEFGFPQIAGTEIEHGIN